MFFIDASMVGSLGAEASASIGLVEPAGWLFGSLGGAVALGFSVQVAHFIGANDFQRARQVMKHGYVVCLLFSFVIMAISGVIAPWLPGWLGGGPDIQHDATLYFLIFACGAPFFYLESLSSALLKSSGDMKVPGIVLSLNCVLDVLFNFIFIFPSRTVSILGADFHVFGFGLRVAGAAIGTTLAYIITSLTLIYFTVVKSKILAWKKDLDTPEALANEFKKIVYNIPSRDYYSMSNLEDLFVWSDLAHCFDRKNYHKSILIDGSEVEWFWSWKHKTERRDDGYYYQTFGYDRIRVPVDRWNGSATIYIPDESIKEDIC